MKKLFLSIIMVICSIGHAQEKKTETIITSVDSVPFYAEKYRELSKAIQFTTCKAMRVSYVYLDGSQMRLDKINKLRQSIISDYERGITFAELANRYTMDGLKDGDLNWFDQGMMVKVFEDAILAHKKGDIFAVDIPDEKWYYVVLKTYDDVKKVRMEIELD